MKKILLIRHGQNDWVGKRLAGRTPGVHLNENGRREAEMLADRLTRSDVDIHVLYSSPLERARETAAPLAERLKMEVQILDGVAEVEYGQWTGRSLDDLKDEARWPTVLYRPSGARFPGGETMRAMQNRAVEAIEHVASQLEEKQTAVVFSHSDVIKAILAHYAGIHFDLFQRLVVSPASISIVGFGDHGPIVIQLNDTAHVPPSAPDEQTRDENAERDS